jgi:selenocysteine-specific elongation factor
LEATTKRIPRISEGEPTLIKSRGFMVGDWIVSGSVAVEANRRLLDAVDAFHRAESLRPGVPVEALRHALPRNANVALADGTLQGLVAGGRLTLLDGLVARVGFAPVLTPQQAATLEGLSEFYRSAGLAPPAVSGLPDPFGTHPDLWPLLLKLEADGRLTRVDPELFFWSEALKGAIENVRSVLAGRSDLGPSDFRDALPVTRKHLMPILARLDQTGVTIRRGNLRDVPGV